MFPKIAITIISIKNGEIFLFPIDFLGTYTGCRGVYIGCRGVYIGCRGVYIGCRGAYIGCRGMVYISLYYLSEK